MSEIVTWKEAGRALAPATSASKRPLIVVLGMARSGLSLCIQVLAMLGVDVESDAPNDLFDLQDDVLALFDRGTATPLHDYPMPPAWWADPRVRPLMNRMRDALGRRLEGGGLCVLCDPRLPKLMPLWLRIFADLDVAPRFVVCLRDPARTARSLKSKEGIDLDAAELRTLDYTVDSLRYTSGQPRVLLRHADWFSDPFANAARLRALIGGDETVQVNDLDVALQASIRPPMSGAEDTATIARQPLVRHFFGLAYKLAERDDADASLADRIRAFTDNYIAFRQLLGPFEAKLRTAMAGGAAMANAGEERVAAVPSPVPAPSPMPVPAASAPPDATAVALLRTQRDDAVAAHAAVNAKAGRLGDALAEAQAAYARMEQAATQAAEDRAAAEREREAARADLAALQVTHGRLQQRMAHGELAHGKALDDLAQVRSAWEEAEGRAARLESTLHEHSLALSDTIASLARSEEGLRTAEETLRGAEEARRRAEIAAESAHADAERLRMERSESSRPPPSRRRW